MFLCFSSGDRYTIVKSCLYHLKNYGIPVWYDYHELILGDLKKEKNFEYAINNNKYFIVIYSESFFKSACALNEEDRIFSQLKERDIVVFPLLYNIKFNELPLVYQNKLENLIYNEIDDVSGSINSINQIVTKYLIDKLGIPSTTKTPTLYEYDASRINDLYIQELIRDYINIASDNFNARIALLSCLFKYIENQTKLPEEYNFISKTMRYLLKYTNFNIAYNHKELIIAELCILNLINQNSNGFI